MAASLSCIFSCTLASLFLPSWVLSLLGFVRKWFLLFVWNGLICFGSVSGCCFSCKTGQNAVRFCFLLFCLGSLCLRFGPQEGKGKSHGKNSRLFWPVRGLPFLSWIWLVQMDNHEQRGFALVLRLAFLGSLFLRVRFCIKNSSKQTGLLVRNVRFWLVSPGFSSSFSLFFLFSCGLPQEQALALAFFDDSTMLPHPPFPKVFLPKSSGCCLVFFLFSRPCFVSKKRYRTG